MAECEIERRASFGKKRGIVQLTSAHLLWSADSDVDGAELRVAFTAIKDYQASVRGGKKVRLSLPQRNSPAMYLLTLTLVVCSV